MNRVVCLLIASVLIIGCAGQYVEPVEVSQSDDSLLSCQEIKNQLAFLDRSRSEIQVKRDGKRKRNRVLGITSGVLFLPGLFWLDGKSNPEEQLAAINERELELNNLAARQGCALN